ncbi:hypothetical protein CCACVL1_22579, partial [Corchorus capsularis]
GEIDTIIVSTIMADFQASQGRLSGVSGQTFKRLR